MPLSKRIDVIARGGKAILRNPRSALQRLADERTVAARAVGYASHWKSDGRARSSGDETNPLRTYFDAVTEGPGVWKWLHYFDIYHRHLQRFAGERVVLVEVGVYSGGSLTMWRQYLGDRCQIHGIDIAPECRVYANDHTTIHIGDQADRSFWAGFKKEVPSVDIVIDDGGHEPEQQIVTLEEMLPHLNPGGVFICEDVLRRRNPFSTYVQTLADELNVTVWNSASSEQAAHPTPFQAAIEGVHLYPFVVVIEKRATPLEEMVAPKHGTLWQPFLDPKMNRPTF